MITLQQIADAVSYVQEKGIKAPGVGIILGTGLNDFINHLNITARIPYDAIPHFSTATVAFHKGELVYGTLNDIPVLVMQGRFHYYEGYSMQQITFPVHVMKALGIQYLLVSNAAGGMNPDFKKGDLIIIEDHINLLPDNPLRGLGNEFGNRFVDMSQPYDKHLCGLLANALTHLSTDVKRGTYVAVMGPNLETKAEYRWLRNTGADMVGMSTVPEVIIANGLSLPCAAVSIITDECDPDHLKRVDITEIIEVAQKADLKLSAIFKYVIAHLDLA